MPVHVVFYSAGLSHGNGRAGGRARGCTCSPSSRAAALPAQLRARARTPASGQAGTEATSPGLGETEFPYNNLLSSGVLTYSNGVFAGGAGYTRHWNAQAQVPFLYSPTAKRFITYDDAESMRVKAAFANQQSLGGIMFWEASEDVTTPGASLSDAVYEGMRLP